MNNSLVVQITKNQRFIQRASAIGVVFRRLGCRFE